MSDLLQRLIALVVGTQHVSTAAADLAAYAPAGASPRGHVVVWPASAGEIAQVLAIARQHGAALVPVRSGARRRGADGAPCPERPTILLDQHRMSSVLHLDETSLVVHAQAGIGVRALEEALNRRGLTLGHYPLETFALPLGALLARRRPELAVAGAGPFHGCCLGVSAVLADGQVVHSRVAPRHAAGPDVLQLLLGCEGAIGIITAGVLRVQRLPESRLLTSYTFPTVAAALEAGVECLRHGARLAALRVYDAADAVRCLGGDRAGAPPLPAGHALLVACSAGPREVGAAEARLLGAAAAAGGGRDFGAAPAEHWWRRRIVTSVDQDAVEPDALVLPAPLASLAPLYDAVAAAVAPTHAPFSASLARVHLGGGCLLLSLAGDRRTRERAAARAREAAAALVGAPVDPLRETTRALKSQIDPTDTLNPRSLSVAPC